ncbi:MAG: glycosyltransferase [Planctomycetota bacterium]|nr:glycosyltransferase [Planctomycetota bacterium]
MRVLILTDALFALHERSLISRLEMGLAAEGDRVARAIPARVASRFDAELFAQAVTYEDSGLPWTVRARARRLLATLRRADELLDARRGLSDSGLGASEPDVVHVFGGGAWDLGAAVAEQAGAGLVLEVWRAGLAGRAVRSNPREGAAVPTVLVAPDPHLERLVSLGLGGGSDSDSRGGPRAPRVRVAPWGVHAAPEPRAIFREGRSIGVMVVGSGREAGLYQSLVRGLATVARQRDDVMIFMDANACERAGLWSEIRRLGLVPRVSLIEDLEGRRDLVLAGDVLVVPEGGGEQRSVVLDAMGAGVAVVAAEDPLNAALQDGLTCVCVAPEVSAPGGWSGPRLTGAPWARAVGELIVAPERAREIARGGWRYVREQRRASDHIRAVTEVYQSLAPAVEAGRAARASAMV